ncbi:MAG: DUF11 domain-containing protein [Planctomycetota bacterium]|nr:MAG: DUF11 domain-containing protein [Planctomycetota bacterium]
MKRFFVRSSLVTGVVGTGLLAYYAQAQRGQDAATPSEPTTAAIAAPEGTPPPIRSGAASSASSTSDPFGPSKLSAQMLDSSIPASAPGQVRLASAEVEADSAPSAPSPSVMNTVRRPAASAEGTPYNQLRARSANSGYEPPSSSQAQPNAEPATLEVAGDARPMATPAAAYEPPQADLSAAAPAAGESEAPLPESGAPLPGRGAPLPGSAAPGFAAAPAAPAGPSTTPTRTTEDRSSGYAAPAALPAGGAGATRLGSGLPSAAPPPSPLRAASPQPLDRNRPTAGDMVGSVRGQGRPGSKQLDGTQAPQLQVRKKMPEEVQVGKPADVHVYVRNNGSAAAHGVRIVDEIPAGTSFLQSEPQANVSGDGRVVWELGTLEPGEQKSVKLQVMPETEGEIGSVAAVEFRAEAGARTVVTRPQLQLEMSAPGEVMIGDEVILTLRISNPGSGVATAVTLYNSLPAQLRHEVGSELEFDVGDLAPRETRQIELSLDAVAAGQLTNVIEARAEGSLTTQAQVSLEVIAPALEVALDGPKKRFLNRRAVYTVSIANAGTAPAKEVELTSKLPKGIQFVSANNAGHYDEGTHTVYWSLAELPEGEIGSVELVTMPVEAGNHKLVVEGKADKNLTDRLEETIAVDGLAAIVFEVVDVQDPVEVNGEVEYEINVLNEGTKSASNIVISAELPAGLEATSATGPTSGSVEGSRVVFAALNRLAPKADTTYRIRAKGLQAGDQRIRVQLRSDDERQPVTKEESTLIYSDR